MKKADLVVPKLHLTHPATATITKVAKGNSRQTPTALNDSELKQVSNSIGSKLKNNEDILQLFPETEIAIKIVTSSVLSPSDLTSTHISYHADDVPVPNNVNSIILETISSYVNKNYNIRDRLDAVLREALFTKGAYAELLLPETNILNAANAAGTELTLESEHALDISKFKDSKHSVSASLTVDGIVTELTVEEEDLSVDFTTDMNSIYGVNRTEYTTEVNATVSAKRGTLRQTLRRKLEMNPVWNTTDATAGGSPIRIKLPVTSVIPLHLSNDPSKHTGYIVLLDSNGTPVSHTGGVNTQGPSSISIAKKGTGGERNAFISKAKKALYGVTQKDVVLNNVDELYTKLLIDTINKKISAVGMHNEVSISELSDTYNLIFSRSMKGLKTKLLFVPETQLQYFAFEYRDNGTGKSLLEKAAVLFSIRAANLFTRILANTKNSVTTTKVTAVLDDADPDPEFSMERIKEFALNAEGSKFPLGLLSIPDWADWSRSVGYRFDFKHPSIPDMSVDISTESSDKVVPDTELDEKIQESIFMLFGLRKEMVMSGFESSLATTIVANNVLFARHIMGLQGAFNGMLSNYVSKILKLDHNLANKVKDIIRINIKKVRQLVKTSLTKDEILMYKEELDNEDTLVATVYGFYCTDVSITLPKVTSSIEDDGTAGLDAFSSMLDTYLPMILSSDSLPAELVGDLSDKMDDITSAIKTILIKNWMDDHNAIPELTKFFTLDNTGQPVYDILGEYKDFTNILSKVVLPHLKDLKKGANKADKVIDKIDNGVEDDPEENDTPDDTPDDTTDTTTDGDIAPGEGDVSPSEDGN